MKNKYIVDLSEVQFPTLELVGGKNASLRGNDSKPK